MSWSKEDALKHKKGLTPEQSKKWAKIANYILKKCTLDKGKNCEAIAIKIANSAVGKRVVK